MVVPDHGPVVVIVTWWLTTLCGVFLGLRIYAKLSRKQGLWWDDYILITSWVLLLAEAIITQIIRQLGFGQRTIDIPLNNIPTVAFNLSIIGTVSCLASTFSKISFGVTLLRLTTGPLRWFTWFCIVTLFLIMLPSALGPWMKCKPENANADGTCLSATLTISYGIFNAAWCAAADFVLALLPWKLIWGLQLKLREKLGVGIAMSMGVLAGVCAIVKGVYIIQIRQQDFSYNGKDVMIWTAVETATAIIAASIPVLRVFFKEAAFSVSGLRGRSHNQSTRTASLSRFNRSQHSSHIATVHAMGTGKDGAWTLLEPIKDKSRDGASQRGILRDEEEELGRGDAGVILQANTVTVTIESDARSQLQAKSWLRLSGI